jgi:hypothetical protein
MTHDELLAKIKSNMSEYVDSDTYNHDKALRAVVELHKPRTDPASTCSGCALDVLYPCPTIQAIEKELVK